MKGQSWGLGEAQLRTVANDYVRGALEYCAAASRSHIDIIERQLRAVAHVVNSRPTPTPTDALMAEACMLPASVRRRALATRMFNLASSLSHPSGDPLRPVSEARALVRLASVTGWRAAGLRPSLRRNWVGCPWSLAYARRCCRGAQTTASRSASSDVGGDTATGTPRTGPTGRSGDVPGQLPPDAVWSWTDGSAEGGLQRGDGGAWIVLPSGEETEVAVAVVLARPRPCRRSASQSKPGPR